MSALPPLRLSPWNNSANNGRIFMKFGIWESFEKTVEKFQVSLKSEKNNCECTGASNSAPAHVEVCVGASYSAPVHVKVCVGASNSAPVHVGVCVGASNSAPVHVKVCVGASNTTP